MAIRFFSEQTSFRYRDKRRTAAWLERVVVQEYTRTVGDIAIIFCPDDYLLQINRQFLDHDYFTDVITFDYSQMPMVGGDIFISIDTVRRNAKQYGTALYDELHRVILHGVLHLCGEKDKTKPQQKQMRQAEDKSLPCF